jgi:hypothetical protein
LKAYVTFVAVLAVVVSKVNTLSDSGLTTMAVEAARVSAGNAALVVPRNVIATVLPARACAWTSFGDESPESHLRAQAVVAALLAPFTVITTAALAVPLFEMALVPATLVVQPV